jgi:AraC-like DNA-binding protein
MGTYFRRWPSALLLDHRDIDFPVAQRRRFWFEGNGWEIPSFENAEVFVGKLARLGVLATEPAVPAALEGDRQHLSRRSVQRRFLRATGVTHVEFRQIRRARYAATLLRGGSSILDAVHGAGYFDQAHLTRSLSRLIGLTPAAILRHQSQLSFSHEAETRAGP